MGGLIGSMLFGGGHALGRPEPDRPGPSSAAGLFLLFRFLRSRREATQAAGSPAGYSFDKRGLAGLGHVRDRPGDRPAHR